ncbi:MAG TPA: response regulator, partial [Holophagaceae bacterium]
VVRELTHLLEVSISKKVALHLDLDPELPLIEADAAQIQQVVMNLVTNASDAIGDQEGHIRLRTSRADLPPGDLPSLPGQTLLPGPYVVIEVQDTGCGMTREVMDRIFDPFFTTKVTGRGLGLSALLGILRGHHAGLRIESSPGRGSRFRLYFPALPTPKAEAPPPAEAPQSPRMGGRILLVDDEEMILETTGSVLSAMGFEVVTARDGLEALAVVDGDPGGFDLVFMDLTMPRMDGKEAFRALRQRDPDMKVILCSGFTEQDILKTFRGNPPSAFVQKPYQVQNLREVLRRVLGAQEGR